MASSSSLPFSRTSFLMSSASPRTRSTNPVRLPPFSSAMPIPPLELRTSTPCKHRYAAARPLYGQECAWIVEVVDSRPWIVHVQAAGVYDDLPCSVFLDVRAVHRPGRGPLEVHALAVITAAVARAFELVLARFPFRGAAQVGAAGKDDKNP